MNVGWSKDITVCVKDSNRSAKNKRSVDKRQGVGVKADPCELSYSCRRKGCGNPKLERWKYSLQRMGKGYFVYQPQKNKITAGNILLGKELLWRFGSKRPRRVTGPLLLPSIGSVSRSQSREDAPQLCCGCIPDSIFARHKWHTKSLSCIKTPGRAGRFDENGRDHGHFLINVR